MSKAKPEFVAWYKVFKYIIIMFIIQSKGELDRTMYFHWSTFWFSFSLSFNLFCTFHWIWWEAFYFYFGFINNEVLPSRFLADKGFFFPIVWSSHTGNHPQEELANFGYMWERKVENFKRKSIVYGVHLKLWFNFD